MERIYIVVIELFILEALLYFTNLNLIIILIILFLLWLFFIKKRKELSIYIFPLIFIIRVVFFVDFSEISQGNLINFKSNIVNGYGKLEKLNNKLPFENKYIFVEKLGDGQYNITGKVLYVKERFIEVEVLKKEKIKGNKFKIYMNKKLNRTKNYISNGCSNLLNGVVLGESRYVYKDIKEMFRYSGASHLLAISGLHIGIIIGLLTYVFSFLKLKKEIKYSCIFLFLTMYILSIKLSPSVIRAYIMGSIYIGSNLFYEKIDLKKSLAFAFITSIIIYPNSFGNISFLMSYISLFSILFIYPKIKIDKDIKYRFGINIFIFVLMLQIILTPLTLYYFKSISILAFVSNIILTPLGSFFIFLGFISFLVPSIILKFGMGWFLEEVYNFIVVILKFLSKIPFLSLKINFNIDLLDIIFFYFLVALTLFYSEIKTLMKNLNLIEK